MASYYYLISSLPMLRPDAEPALDYTAFLGLCRTAVSQPVYQRLETLTVRSEKGPLLAEWASILRRSDDGTELSEKSQAGQALHPPGQQGA